MARRVPFERVTFGFEGLSRGQAQVSFSACHAEFKEFFCSVLFYFFALYISYCPRVVAISMVRVWLRQTARFKIALGSRVKAEGCFPAGDLFGAPVRSTATSADELGADPAKRSDGGGQIHSP